METHSFVFLLILYAISKTTGCPIDEDIAPCHCFSNFFGNNVRCQSIYNSEDLIPPMQVLAKSSMKVNALSIEKSSLLYLPENLFENMHISTVVFVNTEIMSLSEFETAFNGLENSVTSIIAVNSTIISQWDFDQLRNLRKLKDIVLQQVILGEIDHPLPHFPNLHQLTIYGAEVSYVTDDAFSNLPELSSFDMHNNEITEMKRTMFPNPASNLRTINLSQNQLVYLPTDFFDNMPKLSVVYLDKNKFTTLAESPFLGALRKFQLLSMSGNEFLCDCKMRWIAKIQFLPIFNGKCSAPAERFGKEISHLDFESLQC